MLEQTSFRARNDDGSESAATWKEAVDVDWTQLVDENFRVRFLITEIGLEEETDGFWLFYSTDGGSSWNLVTTTSSVVRSVGSTHLTDGEHTTQQIGAGTFDATNGGVDENGLISTGTIPSGNEVEFEFCLQLRGDDLTDLQTVELRVKYAGSPVIDLGSYLSTPLITVSKPPVDELLDSRRMISQP
ncbi:MAG: hypothetical protein KY476_00680 [Planctomycetes bacterium]|nr:hypothetical protein [Planctomycetota bacterium]